jgi:VIT1/CCC1 family predicted Fe2+/Mn2+ transporter
MLRYFVLLFVAALLLLAFRGFARGRRSGRPETPAALWPWLLLPVALALVLAFGLGLKRWAMD